MNNILFIYPSWEERAFLGFKTDVEYHKIHTVYIIKKIKSLNIVFRLTEAEVILGGLAVF